MEDLQGNQDSFVLLAIGSSFKKHDIAILRRHSNGRLFFFLVPGNRMGFSVTVRIFRVVIKERVVSAKEEGGRKC